MGKTFYIGQDPSKQIELTDNFNLADSNIGASAKALSLVYTQFVNVDYQGQLNTLSSNLSTANTNIQTNTTNIQQLGVRIDNFNSTPIGDIQLKAFRHSELPEGWYFCNGDNFTVSSPQGQVLNGLTGNYKSDWGIVITSSTNINVPDLFESNGRGYYLRAVNGTLRQVGSIELSAAPNLTGEFGSGEDNGGFTSTIRSGVFATLGDPTIFRVSTASGGLTKTNMRFDGSLASPVYGRDSVTEVRTSNRGMTPAIFLGV